MLTHFRPLNDAPVAAAPQGNGRLAWQATASRFGEEPRTAGLYKIKGTDPLSDAAGPSFAQSLAGTPAAPTAGQAPGFGDFLDMINPLQHIPVVNMIYRSLTGDQIGGAAQVIGGALFGGPIGALAGTASAVVAHQTGRTLGDAALAALRGDTLDSPRRAEVSLASYGAAPAKRYNFNLSA